MKINWKSIVLAATAAFALSGSWAVADYALTAGSGTTIFSFTCFTTKVCPAGVQVNSAGTEIFTAAAPAQVTGANGTFPVTGTVTATLAAETTKVIGTVNQGTSPWVTSGTVTANLGTIAGAATAVKQPALGTAGSASTDVITVQGITSMTPFLTNPGTAANWGIGATAAAVPANAHYWGVNISGNQVGVTGLALGATTKAPTVAIVDASGNQITAFGGSGGTASNYGSAFPSAGTAIGFSDGTNMVAGRVTTYGTAPTGLPAIGVNAFVTNSNANGQATMANSSPVVIASNQSAVPVSGASGAFASGSFASGSHASGSFASGSFASGALASGSVASGAMVDLGAQADSACSTDNGSCSAIALIKRTNQRITTTSGSLNAYETVAASQTGQALGATGGTGDYLSHCVIYPVTTSPGVVTVFDNTNAAASNAIAFAGGTTSVSNLAPISVPVGAVSTAGAWKVTTGANVIVTCYGRFT